MMAARGGGSLDLDTVVSPGSYEAALLAAGAGVQAVDRALTTGERGFLLVRPPGHHALPGRGMGFCLFNNIAVAALHALEKRGLRRVLIVELGRPSRQRHPGGVLLRRTRAVRQHAPESALSGHRGGGRGGRRPGRRMHRQRALEGGCGDGAVAQIFAFLVEPLTRAFRPELILASSGYDSQAGDRSAVSRSARRSSNGWPRSWVAWPKRSGPPGRSVFSRRIRPRDVGPVGRRHGQGPGRRVGGIRSRGDRTRTRGSGGGSAGAGATLGRRSARAVGPGRGRWAGVPERGAELRWDMDVL